MSRVEDWIGGMLNNGQRFTMKIVHTRMDKFNDRPFRMSSVKVEICPTVNGKNVNSGLVQVIAFSPVTTPAGAEIDGSFTSGPRLVSVGGVTRIALNSHSAVWWPARKAGELSDRALVQIDCLAQAAASADEFSIRFVCRIVFELQPEEFTLVTSTSLQYGGDPPSDDDASSAASALTAA